VLVDDGYLEAGRLLHQRIIGYLHYLLLILSKLAKLAHVESRRRLGLRRPQRLLWLWQLLIQVRYRPKNILYVFEFARSHATLLVCLAQSHWPLTWLERLVFHKRSVIGLKLRLIARSAHKFTVILLRLEVQLQAEARLV